MQSFRAKLLSGFTWRLVLYVSAFILNLAVAQYLGAAGAGKFYLLINNITYAILFCQAGVDAALSYFSARRQFSVGKLFTVSLVWVFCISTLLIVAYCIGIAFGIISYAVIHLCIILFIVCNVLSVFLGALLMVQQHYKMASLSIACVNVLLLGIIVGFILFPEGLQRQYFLPAYLLSAVIAPIIYILYFLKNGIYPSPISTKVFFEEKFFGYAVNAFLFTIAYTLLQRCDYWFVNYFCTEEDLGNYIQTSKINQLILFVPSVAAFTLNPLVTQHISEDKEVETQIKQLIAVYFYIGLIICVLLTIVGYWLFPLLYGKEFTSMYPLFLLLAPGVLMLASAYPITTFFTGQNAFPLVFKAVGFSVAVGVLLDLLLVPKFKTYGAALAGTLTFSFYFFYLIRCFKKRHNFKLQSVFDPMATLKIIKK